MNNDAWMILFRSSRSHVFIYNVQDDIEHSLLSSSSKLQYKKVILRDRKRRTAHDVACPPGGGGGYPLF